MRGNIVRYRMILGIVLLLGASHGAASAQTAADKAAADALFSEGKRLIRKGEDAAACEKFEASLSKLSQLGTQLALASCYERLGKTASAWGGFRAAAHAARQARDRRLRFAEDHAAALEAQLSKIVIRVETIDRVEGLEIKRDGSAVTLAELGSAVPVDPGEYTVEASAPGRIAWSTRVVIPSTPGVVEVSLPALAKLPAARVPRRPRRTLAYGLGGAGLAAVSVSFIFGAVANTKWNDAQAHCRDDFRCDQTGIDLAEGARTMGNLSTGAFLLGAGAVTAAVLLLLNGPSAGAGDARPANPRALHLVPEVGPTQVGVTIRRGF